MRRSRTLVPAGHLGQQPPTDEPTPPIPSEPGMMTGHVDVGGGRSRGLRQPGLLLLWAGVVLAFGVPGSAQSPSVAPGSMSPGPSTAGHVGHGTPEGWRFSWPKGDPAKGRDVFVKLECHSCHEVRGERFPTPSEPEKLGPELSAMGPLHEPEYFAEAIINPNAVIERGRGFEAPDGSSKMPSYNDVVTVQEVIDLVAFLRALKPPSGAGDGGGHDQHH
jgi:L-cysteine S-thiosulfotransferase